MEFSNDFPGARPYIELFGNWTRGIAIGYHNVYPIIGARVESVNTMGVELTTLGRLVRSAKYEADLDACALLCDLAVKSALSCFPRVDRVYYVPMRDSSAGLTHNTARAVAAVMTPEVEPVAAFDWAQFPTFQKGTDLAEVFRMAQTTDTAPLANSTCLLIDDTVWSGSSLALGALRLARVHSVVNVLALSAVRFAE